MTNFTGPSWDLSAVYSGPTDPGIDEDLNAFARLLDRLESTDQRLLKLLPRIGALEPEELSCGAAHAREAFQLINDAETLLRNVARFASCLLSVDGQDDEARKLQGRLEAHWSRLHELQAPLAQILDRATDAFVEDFLASDSTRAATFSVTHSRSRRHQLLPLAQETLVSALSQDGVHAWGRLYTQLSGTLQCTVQANGTTRYVGLAEAASLTQDVSDSVRRDAWKAINRAWNAHIDTCAAAINAIAGWRLELCKRRSHEQEVHFLDAPAHASHIDRRTLDALMATAWEAAPLARRAATAMARACRKQRIGPWDQRAPAPDLGGDSSKIAFDAGLDLVAGAYGEVHPQLGDFVRMMADRNWIEGAVKPRKSPGAYCTSFPKSRAPRVYMTYSGSRSDLTVLAHELGHAFHHWTMRDLPDSQRDCGMSLAETASTFGEAITREALFQHAATPEQQLAVAWEDCAAIVGFLLNIPTRFEFERNFYERRADRPLLPGELKDLMCDAWLKWYGDALEEPDPMFWAGKLHFYISSISFYNFPYLFGFLFSCAVHLQRQAWGGDFFARWRALLRDTGRMTAEDLASKHLDTDIREPACWKGVVRSLENRVRRFERIVTDVVG